MNISPEITKFFGTGANMTDIQDIQEEQWSEEEIPEIEEELHKKDRTVTPEQMAEFQATFRLFDKDKDGMISTNDLCVIMKSVGQNPTEEEVQELMDEVDVDGSGTLDFSEFLDIMMKQVACDYTFARIRDSFEVLAADGTGFLSVEKFRIFMRYHGDTLTDEEVNDLIQDVDPQGTGQINCEDFLRMLAS